ncbi:alpha/beta hydrolase [Streptomyces sp. NPDC050504]|uniref:alpha/beta hydrolase n=1 Tax=Streptomyces sp. NPDC050504 TaxID=3365618 RepID=UPI003797CE7B
MNTNANFTRRAKSWAAAAVAVAALAGAVAPAAAAIPAAAIPTVDGAPAARHATAQRGALVSVTPVADLDRAEVAAFLKAAGPGDGTVRYGIRTYRLTYRTVTPTGGPTTATGLLVLPKGGAHRLDLVSDTHGTMVHRDYAPSVAEDFGLLPPYLHGSAGRAVAAPDYLGLGKGPGTHPYMDTRSSVTASLDMLRASRTAAQRLGRPLTGDVYATGFSQGGQVAAALAKQLAAGADRHLRLRALAPVAGPYDLERAELPAMFDGRINDVSAVVYMTYFLTAQKRLHPIYKDPADVYRAPYDKVVEGLYDGLHTEEQIAGALPPNIKELFTPDFYARLANPSGSLLDVLRRQDGGCAWKPKVPVRLYASSGDRDVPIANARSCAADFAKRGVRAPVLDQGNVDHGGTFMKAGPDSVRWFDRLAGVRPAR